MGLQEFSSVEDARRRSSLRNPPVRSYKIVVIVGQIDPDCPRWAIGRYVGEVSNVFKMSVPYGFSLYCVSLYKIPLPAM